MTRAKDISKILTDADISGNIDVDGVTNLDVVDIDGALTQDGGAVFNEASADVDFRVESNGNANMLTVNGGSDLVGIGADPDLGGGLHVKLSDSGAGVNSSYDTVVIEESGHSGIQILSGTSSTGLLGFNDSGSALRGYIAYAHANDAMEFATGGSERLRIFNDGDVAIGGTVVGNAGTISLNVGTVGSTSGGLQLWNTTSGSHSVQFGDESGTASNHYRGYMEYAHNGDSLRFGTASTERFRVDENGKLLIGSTTANASNPLSKLQVAGSLTFSSNDLNSNTVTDTGISINQVNNGMAMQVLASNHSSTGTSTKAGQYFLKFFYDGNNAPQATLVAGDNCVTFGVSGSNTLTVQMPAGGNTISFITSG